MGDGLPPDLVQLRSTLPIRALVLDCRNRIVARVASTLNQPTQPKTISDVDDVFTIAILDAVKVELAAEPSGHRRRGWHESAEASLK